MTAQGSAHSRLRRALDHGASALVVRALALEAGRLELHDALAVCLVLLEGEPERYGAWAARWASRFVHEAAGADVDEAALVPEGSPPATRGSALRAREAREAVALASMRRRAGGSAEKRRNPCSLVSPVDDQPHSAP